MSDHQRIDQQSKAMHLAIAARIRAGQTRPIELARSNLMRWKRQFGDVLPSGYVEWEVLLEGDVDHVLRILEGDDQDAVRRRSNSPFAGVLTAKERWDILRAA